jgi:GTP-binding protein
MSKLVISIVGRPNVGKSTLFNRIIRRREAIVDDMPGITRDRKHAEAEWEGVVFTLVDTGGYNPKGRDVIEKGVTQQVENAIRETDIILFVVDCTTGITDVDGQVARALRKSGKPTVVAVNKVDGTKREPDASDFIRLGLGEPVSISALGGRGIGDLLSCLIEKMDRTQKERKSEDEDGIKLAIIGKPNVGKSTFINVILGEERLLVTEIPGTTRDSVDVRVQFDGQPFLLVDTAGLRRRSHIHENVEYYSTLRTHQVIERCDVACVFMNGDEGITQQDQRILREAVDARKGVLLVMNKWDLLQNDPEKIRHIQEIQKNKLKGMDFIPVVTVSCKTKLRVYKVLEFAWRIGQESRKRIPSPLFNQLIEDMNRQFQPPAVQGKRVRVLYGTQVGEHPPKFAFFCNYPSLIKESYKRFLENQIRENFGFEGVPLSLLFRKK